MDLNEFAWLEFTIWWKWGPRMTCYAISWCKRNALESVGNVSIKGCLFKWGTPQSKDVSSSSGKRQQAISPRSVGLILRWHDMPQCECYRCSYCECCSCFVVVVVGHEHSHFFSSCRLFENEVRCGTRADFFSEKGVFFGSLTF